MKNSIQLFVFGLILMITLPSFKSNNSVNFTTDNDSLQYKKTPFVNYDEFEKLYQMNFKMRLKKLKYFVLDLGKKSKHSHSYGFIF